MANPWSHVAGRQYNVHSYPRGWLYDWADDTVNNKPKAVPVWTHDRDKALRFNPFNVSQAVAKVRAAGFRAVRILIET